MNVSGLCKECNFLIMKVGKFAFSKKKSTINHSFYGVHVPIYSFKCNNCITTFTALMPINSIANCEQCGLTAEKTIGSSSFILNGKGWYSDGYNSE